MQQAEDKFAPALITLHDNFKLSGLNLVHYLVLRSAEIREAQEFLHHIGLSSLANSESHTQYQLQQVLQWLNPAAAGQVLTSCNFEAASTLQLTHAEELLGAFPVQDRPHIMVTFSAEMISQRMLVQQMLNEGMTVARINCAHDNEEVWLQMITVLKKAMAKTGRHCKVYMDLGGPKIRITDIISADGYACLELSVKEGKKVLITHPAIPLHELQTKDKRPLDIIYIEPRELLQCVKAGEHIYFDDGKFEAVIMEATDGYVLAEFIGMATKKPLLRPGKGINVPDSELTIQPLTEEDRKNIPFICRYADMVGFSFVSEVADLELLRAEIESHAKHGRPNIVLKIERLAAVQNLPALLMNGMKDAAVGVMIARGDLAVEIGFERLSEIQEEILWICESAHVPVIWATQVLESMNKTGYATRSEITDAAMGVRAECVMLNKGRYIVKTIKTLDDILTRQIGHVNKKRYVMRPLGIAKSFLAREFS